MTAGVSVQHAWGRYKHRRGNKKTVAYLLLEPLEGLLSGHEMAAADRAGGATALANTESGTFQYDVEVHTVDTDTGVVLDTQVNVLLDTEAEVSHAGESFLGQLVFTDLGKA